MGTELETLREWAKLHWEHWDHSKRDVTNFAAIMTCLTHEIVMITIKVLERHGWTVDVIISDGVHIALQPGRWPNLPAVVAEVRAISGWPHFDLAWKPFRTHPSFPEAAAATGPDPGLPCCAICTAATEGLGARPDPTGHIVGGHVLHQRGLCADGRARQLRLYQLR
jgi:hypothetical protein